MSYKSTGYKMVNGYIWILSRSILSKFNLIKYNRIRYKPIKNEKEKTNRMLF